MKKNVAVFILLAIITYIIRHYTFVETMFDVDEATYLLWARELLNGNLPYTTYFEDKPVGICLIYAVSFLLFGKSLYVMHIISACFVQLTAFLLYKISQILRFKSPVSVLTGVMYIISSVILNNDAANTEIFFIFCVVLAFYILLENQKKLLNKSKTADLIYFCVGFVFGLGFLIKYTVVFDFIASLLILYNLKLFCKRNVFFIALGFILPEITFMTVYIFTNHFDEIIFLHKFLFFYVSENVPFTEHLKYLFVPFIPLYFFMIITLVCYSKYNKSEKFILKNLLAGYVIIAISLLLWGKWMHYYLQIVPYLSLICGFSVNRILKKIQNKYIIYLLITLILLVSYKIITDNFKFNYGKYSYLYPKEVNEDTPAIYQYIMKEKEPDKSILILAPSQILYDMLNADLPVKHTPSLQLEKRFSSAFPQNIELISAFETKPKYVVICNDSSYDGAKDNIVLKDIITLYLDEYYMKVRTFNRHVLYKKIPLNES